jgi:hypothetical protein
VSNSWELVIHGPTLSLLLACRAPERRLLLKFCDQLRSNPDQQGDYQELDLTGRPLQVRIVGNWAVTFWADHAVKELRVVRIEPA